MPPHRTAGGRWCRKAPKGECISNARQGGCMVLAAKGGIKNGARKGALPRQRSDTIYLPRARALNPPVRRSRSQAEPWQPRAKGPAAGSTLTPVRACQPSGIPESTAPPTGIYRHLNHLRFLPRSFAGAQDDVGGRGSPATSHQRGMHFLARRAVVWFFHKRAPSINS